MPPTPRQTKPPGRAAPSPPAEPAVLARIKPMGFAEDEGIKMGVYGTSGSGKTTLAATFPAPLLWIVCSGGFKPGELRSVDTPENRARISDVTLLDTSEMRDLVRSGIDAKFNTIVLDHASGFQDLILKEILGLAEIPAQKGWGLATQQQYGQVSTQFKEHIRALLSLRCNVLILAHQRVFEPSEGSSVAEEVVGAALMPSITNWLNGACDYLAQCLKRPQTATRTIKIAGANQLQTYKTGKMEYCLRVGPHEVFQTKFRVPGGLAEDVIVDPSYDKIIQLIRPAAAEEPAAE
jgi:hypothetical protein